jgi:F-type H+-transporting ATPase subunit epsilon
VHVALVSPERILWEGEASMVILRTAAGDIAFLNDHAPLVGALQIGKVRIMPAADDGGPEVVAAVHGGFVEVKNNKVTILSDVAELADQVDVARAREALARVGGSSAADDSPETAAARRRAEIRLEVAGATA